MTINPFSHEWEKDPKNMRIYPSMRSEQREGWGMPDFGARRVLSDGSDERSNEGWRFTDELWRRDN
jgi:hypothetical protein